MVDNGRSGELYAGLPWPSSFTAEKEISFVGSAPWGCCAPHDALWAEAIVRLSAGSPCSRLLVWSAGRRSVVPRLGAMVVEAVPLASLTKALAQYLVASTGVDGESGEISISTGNYQLREPTQRGLSGTRKQTRKRINMTGSREVRSGVNVT